MRGGRSRSPPSPPPPVMFNAHRIYGRRRLALMEAGWTRVDVEGPHGATIEALLDGGSCSNYAQPIILLRNGA